MCSYTIVGWSIILAYVVSNNRFLDKQVLWDKIRHLTLEGLPSQIYWEIGKLCFINGFSLLLVLVFIRNICYPSIPLYSSSLIKFFFYPKKAKFHALSKEANKLQLSTIKGKGYKRLPWTLLEEGKTAAVLTLWIWAFLLSWCQPWFFCPILYFFLFCSTSS